MIGKKSKFQEHEQNSRLEVQDKEDSNSPSSREKSDGSREEGESSSSTLQHNKNTGIQDSEHEERFVAESLFEMGQKREEEIEEIPEEIQQIEGKYTITRPTTDSTRKVEEGNGGSPKEPGSPLDKKGPIIITTQNIKSDTDLLWDEICNGVKGKNSGIPMGFNRLNRYLGLRKSIYTTIGAAAGCGKTSLVDCAYVLNPYDWYIKNKHKASTNVKFEVIYFSMERKKTYKLAKWLCMKIWKEEQKLVTTDELLSWQNTLTPRIQEIAKFYIDNYFKEMTESGIVTIIDGQQNPTGIYKFMKSHALKRGKEEEISEYEHRYVPNDDNLITNVVHDHAGKTKNENIGGKYDKKLSIDKASEYYCWA